MLGRKGSRGADGVCLVPLDEQATTTDQALEVCESKEETIAEY